MQTVKVKGQGDHLYEVVGVLPLSRYMPEDWVLLKMPKISNRIPRGQVPYKKSELIPIE